MQTIEIVVYMLIAVIIGGIVLVAVGRVDGNEIAERVSGLFKPKAPAFAKVDAKSLPPLLFRTWEDCGLGILARNATFQFTGTSLTAENIFSEIKRMGLCDTFSSKTYSCGTREDLNLAAPITNAHIYTARCDPATKQLIVS